MYDGIDKLSHACIHLKFFRYLLDIYLFIYLFIRHNMQTVNLRICYESKEMHDDRHSRVQNR